MGNTYNIILQGTEQDDKLVAHWEYSKAYHGYVRYTTVHGAGGDDTLSVDPALAYDGVELDGDDGNDLLLDGEGNDTLSGGAGDDDIVAAQGKDVIDGGEGSDTLRTGGDLSRLTITGIEHLFAIYDVQIAGFDLGIFETIEMDRDASIIFREAVTFDGSKLVGSHLRLIGSMEDDFLDLSATTATVEMHGERGDDHLLAGSGEALLQGDGGDDELAAGSGNATIEGGNGNDDISGGVGKDMLDGGSGNDTINGGDGDDRISSGIGNDTVKGGDGDDQISGSSVGNKAFYGGGGDDLFENLDDATGKVTLVGGQGNDTLRFHGDVSALHVSGIETLEITLKVDRNDFEQHLPIKASGDFLESFKHIFGDSHDPSVAAQIELTSSDFHWRDQHSSLYGDIYGTNHADDIDMAKSKKYWTISGGNGDDILTAAAGGSELYAGNGDDKIVGGKGGDEINDGAGNDIIDGRGGKDTFYEQDGANTFIFEAGSGTDYLYGFDTTGNGKDKIDLAAVKSISSYSDLIAHHVDEKFGGLYVEFSDKDRVWLDGFSKEMLDSSMFIF